MAKNALADATGPGDPGPGIGRAVHSSSVGEIPSTLEKTKSLSFPSR